MGGKDVVVKCPKCEYEWQFSGYKSRVDNSVFRATVEKYQGHVAKAARELGMHIGTALAQSRRLGIKASGNDKRKPHITTESLLAAYKVYKNIKLLAETMKLPIGFVYERLREVPEYHVLKKQFRKQPYLEAQFTRRLEVSKALVESGGSMTGAAVILGLSRERVRQIFNRIIESDSDEVSKV